jgi:mRNA interferase RelE/StbE
MAYAIEFERHAIKDLRRLPRTDRERIMAAIETLGEEPRPSDVTKLSGSRGSIYRIRVGDYRVLYKIEDDTLMIYVVRVGDRKDIYRHMID